MAVTTTTVAPTAAAATRPAWMRGAGEGMRAMAPVLAGLAPFGFVIGATVATTSMPSLAGWATSWLIYAGSAQLAVIQLIDGGAAVLVVVATTIALNARFIAYGAGLAQHWRDEPRRWRAMAAYLLVDPTYVLTLGRYARPGSRSERRAYFMGAALTLWVGWQVVTAAGVLVGAGVPDGLALEFAAPLCLVGLLVRQADAGDQRGAAAVAAAVSLGAIALPLQLGALVGALAGVAVACTLGRSRRNGEVR
ncbi:MAG TPA: AzlC family ABC transporter permease [Acidimicrobiia bacterium]